jgi:hypothetical protein
MQLNPALFDLPPDEVKLYGAQNLTYGSLTERGIKSVVDTLASYIDPSHIYGFDLGCGDGELQYHLQTALVGSTWEGVEISQSRVDAVVRDVCIWQGDMFEESFKPYNVLHADNLCLEDALAERLERKIVEEFCGIYISYREPSDMLFLRRARWLGRVPTETSWTTRHYIQYYAI